MHPGVVPAQGSSTSHPAPHYFRAFQGSRLALVLPSLGWTPLGKDQEMREVCARTAGIFSAPISHSFLRNKGGKYDINRLNMVVSFDSSSLMSEHRL